MTMYFQQYRKLSTFDLDCDIWPTLKNFNIDHNSFLLRCMDLIFGKRSLWQGFSDSTINFERMTFTMTFHMMKYHF